MKKIIALILIALMCLVMFCACEPEKVDNVDTSNRFMIVHGDGSYTFTHILVDRETKVMYLFVKNGYGGGLTVMLDEEGKPMIYEGDLQ